MRIIFILRTNLTDLAEEIRTERSCYSHWQICKYWKHKANWQQSQH